ncbi:iron-sulfur assembly protein IscA-like 2, mitochondrial [Papaver somniferum]|uniref:iron-sulfur assembly protein IscA-like 2, mitochondrial n=1 Tax=Papaver somniferum TaxID=3469 RepID=UPI000E6FE24C|nr:iron-sulfur assembly protein IscA-like 2, mitochondrial [Papaver somniferum]
MSYTNNGRSLFHHLTPFITNRLNQGRRILSYSSSSTAVVDESSSSSSSVNQDDVHMTENCIQRLKELHAKQAKDKMLRLSVEAGGCSGFQYVFELDDEPKPNDRVFTKEGVKLVVDKSSYGLVKGATVDYVEELIRSAFVVTENPSAVGGCSCKSSFMVK